MKIARSLPVSLLLALLVFEWPGSAAADPYNKMPPPKAPPTPKSPHPEATPRPRIPPGIDALQRRPPDAPGTGAGTSGQPGSGSWIIDNVTMPLCVGIGSCNPKGEILPAIAQVGGTLIFLYPIAISAVAGVGEVKVKHHIVHPLQDAWNQMFGDGKGGGSHH